ncbi:MAG: TIR domain-containing protein [Candidatus Hodarchaeota archaeon]
MAKDRKKPPSRLKQLNALQLRTTTNNLKRLIEDLDSFDVSMIEDERYDEKIRALQYKIDDALKIFGQDSSEYCFYKAERFDNLGKLWLDYYKRIVSLSDIQTSYQKGIDTTIARLIALREMLLERLEYLKEEDKLEAEKPVRKQVPSKKVPPGNRKVFIVHGHDELAKQTVARFISQIDLEPIILHEQPSQGKTVIEKLENHTLVDFAVVLLTPDDIGHPAKNPDKAKPRARQNVILELGMFLGTLKRDRVCALYKGDVEIPSDYKGVLYIPMDDAGAWKLQLAKEMKHAGIKIDINKVI